MARSPTVSNHPKPKAYPVGWEENGGLSRPVSMGGIDLPIPLSPLPPPVPNIPQQYRRQQDENVGRGVAEPPSPKVLYDHERDGINGQVPEKKSKKQQQKQQQIRDEQQPAAQETYEYVPEASPLSSLQELWEITVHGKPLRNRPHESLPLTQFAIPEGVYVLNMYRGAPLHAQKQHHMADGAIFTPEHFAFGPTPSNPFYTIQALPDALHPNNPTIYDPRHPETYFNDLLIMRRNPVTNKDTSVLTMGLNPHAATSHRRRAILAASGQPKQISPTQGDELITLIYPKQAAMMAIDSSSIHVDERTGRIVGGDAQTMAREAVERAAETECCRLSWDVARDRYYLYHPGVGNGGEVYLIIIDGGNYSRNPEKGGEASQSVGFDVPGGSKGSIKLINVDTSEAIVVLDFKSGLLFVNTMATRKIPSLYIVDVAVSTVLAVAVVEGRRIRDVKLLHSLGPGAFSGPTLAYPPAVATIAGRGKHNMLGWDETELGREDKMGVEQDAKKNGGVLDLAGLIVNGVITVIAFIVGLFWAIGSGLGKLFTRGRKNRNGQGDVESSGVGPNGGAGGYSPQQLYGYQQR
ncbi:hypothetical protein DFH27DRAFT_526532 [Peziza echinospora]|nr:hypothetical protein DFH27DRAFT_526532 [Peziza echinospora]